MFCVVWIWRSENLNNQNLNWCETSPFWVDFYLEWSPLPHCREPRTMTITTMALFNSHFSGGHVHFVECTTQNPLLLYAFYCVPWSFAPWWSLHLRLRLQGWLSWFLVGRFHRWMLVFRRKIQRILRRLSTRRLRSGVNGRIFNLPKQVETSLYSNSIWCLTRKSLWFDIFGVQTADTPNVVSNKVGWPFILHEKQVRFPTTVMCKKAFWVNAGNTFSLCLWHFPR